MPGPRIVFDYPIKRPYPWRYTALFVSSVSALVFTGLIYINLAVVGLTPRSFPSTTFEKSPDPSWIDRVNIKKTLSARNCEPATLVPGGTYRTQNGIFPYTIQRISSSEPGGTLSSLAYEGQVIENCYNTVMSADGGNLSGDTKFAASTTCTFSGGTNLTIGFRADPVDPLGYEPQNQMAHKASYLVPLLAQEAAWYFWKGLANSTSKFYPCSFATTLEPGTSDPIWQFCSHIKPMSNELEEGKSLMLNFLQVLQSATYSDLGIKSPYNLFSNPELMRQTLQPNFKAMKYSNTSNPYNAYDVLRNMTKYGLPFEEPQPVQFHAQYLCNGMAWKSPSNLVLDVLVATVSLFMAYWGILNVVLEYLATRSSPRGNHCVCPNCNELPSHMPSSPVIHEPRPLDSGTERKSVLTRSQSMPASVPL
ncbi:hypothetical protein BDV93DRAFT_544867 [Ceratobasidium sp. AG-I]|nr:hypothetical protein BDV93DRAFT_544867 [Ceratobasidium sp. AG-I]